MKFEPSPTTRRLIATVWLSVYAGACSGDDGREEVPTIDDFSCAFQADLTGDIVVELSLEELGCGYSLSFDSGVSVVFVSFGEDLASISLDIDEIAVDEVGEFPARLSLVHEDERRFVVNDCTVTVTTHEPDSEGLDDFGKAYLLHGTGSCAGPAESVEEPGQTIDISEFQFAMPTSWSE